MTSDELRRVFNDYYDKHGLEKPIESPYHVDAETYGHVCSEILSTKLETGAALIFGNGIVIVDVGPNRGILFKGVELLIKSEQ